MSWVTVYWSAAAGICLALAAVHLLVWLRGRDAIANLLFSISAVAAAVITIQELMLMRAQTPAEFAATLRWMHVPAAVIVIAVVWFTRDYLGAGRAWLAWLITGLRVLILLVNFSSFPNATFQEIHALREVHFLGETMLAPVGEASPWRLLTLVSDLLLPVFALDAAIAAWRLGRPRQALVLGGSVLLGGVLAVVMSGLMVRGILPVPMTALVFQVLVLGMAFELSVDLVRARHLARELRDSEERMRLAARAADLGFWEWDVKGDRLWLDDVGKARTGSLGPELVSRERYLMLVHPDDRERLRQATDRAIDCNEDFEADFRLIGVDGGERWVRASGQVERDAQGEPSRLRGISLDITARKHFESESQKLRSALGHTQRVSAMGQLSAALAHELSQPLGAILHNAEAGEMFLRRDPPDFGELREIFVDIQRDDQRAAAVIDRMRALLKHRELRLEVIPVQELVRQVADLLGIEMQTRHATLQIKVAPAIPDLRGDRVQLQQVLVNLLLNGLDALDAVPNGVRELEISAAEAPGGLVELAVKDTGTGIDPDRLPELFEPFFTTKSEGSGIGLAISKTIVEAHRGRIWAENNPDGGACIRFSIPAARPEMAA